MNIEVWSDVVCPWCYIGKRHLERALSMFEPRDEVRVIWRSYELDPDAPRVRDGDYLSRLARKYEINLDGARAMVDRMTRAATTAGLDFKLDIARGGNTFDAHRLIHLGAREGIADAVKERFMSAYFIEGLAIGERDVLATLATEAGLNAAAVDQVLGSEAFAAEVRTDEARAAAMGVRGVPFFVVDETYGVSGAQPPEVLLNVLQRAWQETHS